MDLTKLSNTAVNKYSELAYKRQLAACSAGGRVDDYLYIRNEGFIEKQGDIISGCFWEMVRRQEGAL